MCHISCYSSVVRLFFLAIMKSSQSWSSLAAREADQNTNAFGGREGKETVIETCKME